MNVGSEHALRSAANPSYLSDANPGIQPLGTHHTETQATLEQYENVFGPAAREIKFDNQRNKRHQRWHLPDVLKGANQYLTDRVDGLITDATNSPFTRNILPYVYLENPDQKLKWNVYSFDEGMASRVPYESAARVLPQTKRSFAGYVVRQGLAIAMEHNFMASEAGRLNFKRQLLQLVGSIQLTNDLDVHVALITAPSYQKYMDEKYMDSSRTFASIARQYSDTFGIMHKTADALDFLIEDAKNHFKTWGSQPPSFLMCNGALTKQLTMHPEKTNYLTNGLDGLRKLAQGPDLPSYRGLSIINTRKFTMEAGIMPRDLLRRRVRVCQHYYIPWDVKNPMRVYEFYDESKDVFFTRSWIDLFIASLPIITEDQMPMQHVNFFSYQGDNIAKTAQDQINGIRREIVDLLKSYSSIDGASIAEDDDDDDGDNKNIYSKIKEILRNDTGEMRYPAVDLLVLRPNIEHEMLGILIGRGGTQELGATFWGQTELSCYDDAQHGIWGMSYKYHERAVVTNERNLIRLFDVAFDGYNGGMDDTFLNWIDHDEIKTFADETCNVKVPYVGKSMVAMMCATSDKKDLANPLILTETEDSLPDRGMLPAFDVTRHKLPEHLRKAFDWYFKNHANIGAALNLYRNTGDAGYKAIENETQSYMTSYHGYLATYVDNENGTRQLVSKINGTGHLGQCYEGVSSVRMGRGQQLPRGPVTINHLV